ncbi:hypothetical protein LBMAG53_35660 [Planctomycetota bacterium]|nr:hypothetical protein LBMAG53_35660 [Planctomycetota bacterium]
MARGQHRFWTTRNTRGRAIRAAIKASYAPAKKAAGIRRDARVAAKIKALIDSPAGLSAECQSWLSVQTGRPASKLSRADIEAVLA